MSKHNEGGTISRPCSGLVRAVVDTAESYLCGHGATENDENANGALDGNKDSKVYNMGTNLEPFNIINLQEETVIAPVDDNEQTLLGPMTVQAPVEQSTLNENISTK